VTGEAQRVDRRLAEQLRERRPAARLIQFAGLGIGVRLAAVHHVAVAADQQLADVIVARQRHGRETGESQDDEGREQALHGFTPLGVEGDFGFESPAG
jgi:hypothetical protein